MTVREWRMQLRKDDPFLTSVRVGPKLWVIGDESDLDELDPRPPRG